MRETLPKLFLIFYFIIPLVVLLLVRNPKIKKTYALLGLTIFIPAMIIGVFGSSVSFNFNKIYFSFRVSGLWCEKTFDCTFNIMDYTDCIINAIMLFPIGIVIAIFSKKPIVSSIIWGIMIGVLIEGMQCLLPINRYPQLQDSFLNAFSVVMGSIYVCLINLFKKFIFIKTQKSKIKRRIKQGDTFFAREEEYCKIVLKFDIAKYINTYNAKNPSKPNLVFNQYKTE